MPALIEHLCLQRCSQFGCGRAGGERSEWGLAGVGSSCQPAAAEMAGAVEDIHSGFSLSSTGKWMPRMAAPLEAPNGCYSARTPAKLAMAGRMAGLLEPVLAYNMTIFIIKNEKCYSIRCDIFYQIFADLNTPKQPPKSLYLARMCRVEFLFCLGMRASSCEPGLRRLAGSIEWSGV